jgi:uncharacterized protein (DUF1015 family)
MNVRAFRGFRYRRAATADVSAVVAPPYDQISPGTLARLHALSPHNVVRITLPEDDAEHGIDRYRRAATVLDGWIGEGVWTADEAPAIYPYAQRYTVGGQTITRTSLIALGAVSDYAAGVVRPHERTHAGPKRDRLALLEATGSDTGLLFMLVSDADGGLREATTPAGPPIAEARDLRGEQHTLWRITDPAVVRRVQALMAPRPVIIADGHHRYETAVEYARGHPAARWKMMAFCVLEAPGLTILPNHRLVHGVEGFSLERLARAAGRWFDVEALDDPLAFRPSSRAIGVVTSAGAQVFRLRDDEAFAAIRWPASTSAAWRELAVSVLHEGLLEPCLGITGAMLDARTHVDYTAEAAEAVDLARAGKYQAAFLIAPTTPGELAAVVAERELLPQKSTHFYPKLLDGLVFHRLEPGTPLPA